MTNQPTNCRVHEYSYLHHLEQKSLSNSSADVAVPSFYAPAGYLDVDTPLRALSLAAAKRFCGAAMLAVDKIMSTPSPPHTHPSEQTIGAETEIGGGGGGGCRAAFVVGRPPGHHAGPRGCVPSDSFWMRPDMISSGFCLLNTVAVAAVRACVAAAPSDNNHVSHGIHGFMTVTGLCSLPIRPRGMVGRRAAPTGGRAEATEEAPPDRYRGHGRAPRQRHGGHRAQPDPSPGVPAAPLLMGSRCI